MGASLSLVIALGLVFGDTAVAQNRWYQLYDQALEAIEDSDWALAEEKLESALARRADQGRRVRFYGLRLEPYIPEVYLAIVYFNQGRPQEAIDLFQKVQRDALVARGEPGALYEELQSLEQAARVRLARAESERRIARLVQQARALFDGGEHEAAQRAADEVLSEDPTNRAALALKRQALGAIATAETADAEAARRTEFEQLLGQARSELDSRQFAAARRAATAARSLGFDDAGTAALLRDIQVGRNLEAAQLAIDVSRWQDAESLIQRVRDVDPSNRELTALLAAIVAGRRAETATVATGDVDTTEDEAVAVATENEAVAVDPESDDAIAVAVEQERTALRGYFLGNYEQAIVLFEDVVRTNPSRAYFYQACSQAAICLLREPERETRLQAARELFSRAMQAGDSSIDRGFVSPAILRLLEQ